MGWAIQFLAVASALATQSQATIAYVQTLPPAPPQSMITCKDAAWEQANLTTVAGSRLHSKLAPYVQKLISDAKAQAVPLAINVAYRSCDYQIQLRANNCGLGDYNIYQKPSNLCNPPTEPAGKSLHNEGLAVDFSCSGFAYFPGSPCLQWLEQNGKKYNLIKHEVEDWHWSTTGK